MAFDLVIRNGTVVDGSGGPSYRADVGVVDDTIVSIGRIRDKGKDEIDAEGHLVSPGFIEGHTHLDAQMFWDPLGTCSSWHGVTSVVMGNCGFTVAPCRESEKHLAIRSLERAEDISGAAMEAGIRWRWETYPEYLDAIDSLPKGLNLSGYVGHSALRSYVMGDASFERKATTDEVAAMQRELRSALKAGAIGFSTSRSPNHRTSDDKPVASVMADWSEVQELVGVMTELGSGVFELAQEQHPDLDAAEAYCQRLLDLAVSSGRPMTFVIGTAPGFAMWREQLKLLDRAVAAGARMYGQSHTREFLSMMNFATNLPFEKLPQWAEFRKQPVPAQLSALRADAALRGRLADEAMNFPYVNNAIGSEVRPPNWDAMRVFNSGLPPYQSVTDVARARGVSPAQAVIDLSVESDFGQFFAQPFANHDIENVLELLSHPQVVVGVSDSGAHVSQIIDSSIPTFLLGYWVRTRQAITWERAIRMLTYDAASLWGFADRGLLREGFRADLAVIDPATVAPGLPHAVNDLPAGAKRLVQKGVGIKATTVNGRVFMRDNEHTGALAGRLLRASTAYT